MGVRYGEATGGARRFLPPVAANEGWRGVRNATEFQFACPQRCILPTGLCPNRTSEDCLFLDVYVPKGNVANLTVMVFLYGGGFWQGAANVPLYYSHRFVNESNVIVVIPQYRIGSFGYLTSTKAGIEGNMGLLDQLAALRWTKANVAAFGGNPNDVTVFGESAGAMSVGCLLASPTAAKERLFHRAIMESNPLNLPVKPKALANDFGASFSSLVGCKASDLSCLQSASTSSVLDAEHKATHYDLTNLLQNFLPWIPVLDDELLPLQPFDAFVRAQVMDVPILLGFNQNEGNAFVYEAIGDHVHSYEYDLMVAVEFKLSVMRVLDMYKSEKGNNFNVTATLVGDFLFGCATQFVQQRLLASSQRTSPTFSYRFNHVLSFKQIWVRLASVCRNASCHGSELPFVFGSVVHLFTPEEQILSNRMVEYWTSFARNGAPATTKGGGAWPAYGSQRLQKVLETPSFGIEADFKAQECDWFAQWYLKHHKP